MNLDYASLHGPGESNFSSSPRRLPAISASQALHELRTTSTRCISTGLKDLDAALQNRDLDERNEDGEEFHGGVARGRVTEIYGPPGIGKTTLGMQLAASALHKGLGVVWIDASHPIPGPRLSQILSSFQPRSQSTDNPPSSPPHARDEAELLEKLTHFATPSLAHLIALLCNTTITHPPPNTGLIVIESFSTLINNAFPRSSSDATPKKPGAPNPSSRRFPILQYIINTLQKLAVTRNLAVVITSQCVTKMRPGIGAALLPSISTPAWEQGLGCRIVLYRDWGWNDSDGEPVNDVRLAEVVKAEGVVSRRIVGFTITESGIQHLALPTPLHSIPTTLVLQAQAHPPSTPTLPRPLKRKLSATDLEIPDSDAENDEDYGWGEEDEEDVPPMPPQTQGSEDIFVAPVEVEAEEHDEVDGERPEKSQRFGLDRVIEDSEGSEDELA